MEQGTQTGRQIVMAVDDSPHSHAAWLFAVHNILRDDDKVVLLHGVTTNVQVTSQPPPSRCALACVRWRHERGNEHVEGRLGCGTASLSFCRVVMIRGASSPQRGRPRE